MTWISLKDFHEPSLSGKWIYSSQSQTFEDTRGSLILNNHHSHQNKLEMRSDLEDPSFPEKSYPTSMLDRCAQLTLNHI